MRFIFPPETNETVIRPHRMDIQKVHVHPSLSAIGHIDISRTEATIFKMVFRSVNDFGEMSKN